MTKLQKFNQLWFRGLDEPQTERRKTLVKNSKRILKALIEITEFLSENTLTPSRASDYNKPNWALLKAHEEGYRRALHDLKNIMETDPNERQ